MRNRQSGNKVSIHPWVQKNMYGAYLRMKHLFLSVLNKNIYSGLS